MNHYCGLDWALKTTNGIEETVTAPAERSATTAALLQ